MKKMFLFFLSMAVLSGAMAQLTVKAKCPDFVVDIFEGKVNGLKANAPIYDIKTKFPCFTSVDEEGTTAKCGAAVYFKDRDIKFFTDRDYVEIGPKFKGKLTVPLMGAKRTAMFQWLGNPKMKDDKWDAFQTQYGILILRYDAKGLVNLIQFSTKSTDNISICE